jgi:predicted nucleic acid-binding protein
MTKNVIFDSFALIAHFRNEEGAEYISSLLADLSIGDKEGFISLANVGEIYYMLHRKSGEANAEKALHKVRLFPIEIITADWESTYQAAKLKSKYRISYADAFAASLTIQKKGTLITGDPEFESLKKEKDFKVHFINRDTK